MTTQDFIITLFCAVDQEMLASRNALMLNCLPVRS